MSKGNTKYKLEDFIGKRYGEDGRYEVVSTQRGHKSARTSIGFTVKCHECAKDSELWGDALFTTTKNSIEHYQRVRCGCHPRPKWTQEQQVVRIGRACAERSLTFLGFVGEYYGIETKIILKCNVDGNVWYSSTVNSFFTQEVNCSICNSKKLSELFKLTDSKAIDRFLATGKFAEGVKFSRAHEYKFGRVTWDVYCPKCSNDEYVKAGVCPGVFTSTQQDLMAGYVPCRCCRSYRWTEQQMRYRIEKELLARGVPYEFVGWVDRYTNTESKMVLRCTHHGDWSADAKSFLAGNGCPSCATSGFKPDKPATLYVITVIDQSGGGFTGYGITNNYKRRRITHATNLRKQGFSIENEIMFDLSTGALAKDIEGSISKEFPTAPQSVEGFIREATHYSFYNNVVSHVQQLITLQ